MSDKSNIPSFKSILIPVLVLLVFYNLKFYLVSAGDTPSSRYDWKHIRMLDSIGPISILSVTGTNLELTASGTFSPSADPVYVLPGKNQTYFFRFEYRTKHGDTIKFFDVHWLKGLPKQTGYIKQIKWAEIPLKSPGSHTAVTIGDALVCRGNAEYFRLILHNTGDLKFLGPHRDVLNFAYLGRADAGLDDMVKFAESAPPAKYYILFFRPTENVEFNTFSKILSHIQILLKTKNAGKIFWVLPDNMHQKLKVFQGENNIIVTYHLEPDNTLPSREIYEKIAHKISQYIRD